MNQRMNSILKYTLILLVFVVIVYFIVTSAKKKPPVPPHSLPSGPTDDPCYVGNWSSCSVPCGGGTMSRSIISGSSNCPELNQVCNTGPCPSNCTIGEWSEWSDCSATCGNGEQKRTRTVSGGDECGPIEETKSCYIQPCAVDCEVYPWSDWSDCSATECEGSGMRTRTRNIKVQPVGDGKSCPPLIDTEPCVKEDCSVDCVVSDWEDWSTCDKDCGGGYKTRNRKIITQPLGAGYQCPELQQSMPCNTQVCDKDCKVTDFSEWSQCSQSCGTGSQYRVRNILENPMGNGAVCPSLIEYQDCNEGTCASNCIVSDWSDWSSCRNDAGNAISCGGGYQVRTRNIISTGTSECPNLSETRQCGIEECPVDCTVTNWSNWSECDQPCGGGFQIRTRDISQFPNAFGKACPVLVDTQQCNTDICSSENSQVSDWSEWSACTGCGDQLQTRTRHIVKAGIDSANVLLSESRPCQNAGCPVDCILSEWSNWSACDKLCGTGQQTRDRFIIQHAENGGAQCGNLQDIRNCNEQSCPINCVVSDWGDWSKCDKDCGGGWSRRERTITTEPQYGGDTCPSLTEDKPCNTQACPVDCVVSDWSNWSECDKECGGGNSIRTRIVLTEPQNGGAVCPVLIDSQPCNTQICPVDCKVSTWSDWNTCSATCGGGDQARYRNVLIPSTGGGADCGPLEQHQQCNTQLCPQDCTVSDWSNWSECSTGCGGGVKFQTRVVLSPAVAGGKSCPTLINTGTCNINPCKIDCQQSDWGQWGPCSATCGVGTHVRTRVTIQQPQYGGAECGPLEDKEICNEQPCPTDCVLSQWSPWTSCSATCGPGIITSSRTIISEPTNGGAACPTNLTQTQSCNIAPCPIDCQQTDWSQWGSCSAPCGGGTQQRSRSTVVQSQYGGAQCGPLTDSQSCNTMTCPNCNGHGTPQNINGTISCNCSPGYTTASNCSHLEILNGQSYYIVGDGEWFVRTNINNYNNYVVACTTIGGSQECNTDGFQTTNSWQFHPVNFSDQYGTPPDNLYFIYNQKAGYIYTTQSGDVTIAPTNVTSSDTRLHFTILWNADGQSFKVYPYGSNLALQLTGGDPEKFVSAYTEGNGNNFTIVMK